MKLSIITINRNNADGLRKTIESVVSQTYTDFEYIIIDGASTDGSVEIIKEYADRITYWVSEVDNGIFNAMNKGILKASGDYYLFLNSGDILIDDNVVLDFVKREFRFDIISGILCEETLNGKQRIPPLSAEIDFEYFYLNTLPHPASFIKASVFQDLGNYNEKNRIVSDWELFFTALVLKNKSYTKWDRRISIFDMTGISSGVENSKLEAGEKILVMQNLAPLVYKTYVKQQKQITNLMIHDERYQEYMKLRSGKFLIIIRILLWINKKFEKWKTH